jgi:hypothetical protein
MSTADQFEALLNSITLVHTPQGRRRVCNVCDKEVSYGGFASHKRSKTCRIIGLHRLIAEKLLELKKLEGS